ncbi:MAG: dTDP-4-dehydrorhamnose reductase family protein [Algoriphagus aquaeductus]|uniref:dTDP-4-dehydrorhamnose reductase family protein n=1 Tax=Algoriphagus aquaeductus TaxID=475299 RepID=UPI00391C3686
MKKVLVLGSTGMLGHQVVLKLNQVPDFQVYDISFRNKFREETIICDVTDFKMLEKLINDILPDFIINCIGILIKGSNQNPKNSILINAFLPHFLVSEADKINAKVIHISTDCVFSGRKGEYNELDITDADDIYGRSKALGEILSEKHLTLRTSIIGPELKETGEGLFHWFMFQKDEIEGYTDAFWSGVTTLELSKVIVKSIHQNIKGLYHVTNNQPISKFDLLSLLNTALGRNIIIKPSRRLIKNKSLIDSRYELDYNIPSYSEMIKEMTDFLKYNKDMYNVYKGLL